MSEMYREEVPAYGDLLKLVSKINAQASDGGLVSGSRLEKERHGAIRVGTPAELSMLRRLFALMGMQPVGYYDLAPAGLPVHSTAFRPVTANALEANPFRLFTSLLRVDLIEDEELRTRVETVLSARSIFSQNAIDYIEHAEAAGGVSEEAAEPFLAAILPTFQWRDEALVSKPFYDRLIEAHPLIADIVCFKGPHINHLTPRTIDIDAAQAAMRDDGFAAKKLIEGPPKRACPILLRQTAFRAIAEPVTFPDPAGDIQSAHTARFGEIEARGAALTPKGRAFYDKMLADARAREIPDAGLALREAFSNFPDDWPTLRQQGLAYFRYGLTALGKAQTRQDRQTTSIERALAMGWLIATPITYEDFLPISAAGIFQSNLADDSPEMEVKSADQLAFEAALGARTRDPFAIYADLEQQSIVDCGVKST